MRHARFRCAQLLALLAAACSPAESRCRVGAHDLELRGNYAGQTWIAFSKEQWAQHDSKSDTLRFRMLKDLLECHLRVGASSEQMLELLGPPYLPCEDARDASCAWVIGPAVDSDTPIGYGQTVLLVRTRAGRVLSFEAVDSLP